MDTKTVEKALNYQRQILSSGNIPNKFKPTTSLFIVEPYRESLQNEFEKMFNEIFLKHLTETIKANELALEIEKAKLASISRTTTTTMPNSPNTTVEFTSATINSTQQAKNKRKNRKHPQATKQAKLSQHFLGCNQTTNKGIT
jgi:hypothetical protein